MPSKDKFKPAGAEPWERISSSEGDDSSTPSPDSSLLPESADPHIPNNQDLDDLPWWRDQEEIVISGISCRFPESDNMSEFAEHLLNGDDLITENDRRWEPGYYDLPKRHGKLKSLAKFDAQFFGVHPKQATYMDPQLRIMLEVAFEAIVDAGINPQKLRGTKTGVFVGASTSESAGVLTRDPETVVGYSLTGCTRSMFANRLSFTFDLRGPSFAVDTACSSSLLALQLAVDSIRQGQCDAALVTGCQLTLTPTAAIQFLKLGMLSPTGESRSFDANGEGYVRSEGVAAIFIQKSSVSQRSYATVVHAKSNTDGYKEQGITFPIGARQAVLLEEVYSEAGIDPATISYVEAHGTGTKVGDPQEANAVAEVFCKPNARSEPLLMGSVKSNMGHCEPASGLAAIAKVLIAMEGGIIPPNLHYDEPNPYIPALSDGRLNVVSKPTPWNGGLVGINSFGFGGANTHALLRSNPKTQAEAIPKSDFPLLFCTGGRTQEGVESILGSMEEHIENPHYYSLLSEMSNVPTNLYPHRGFMISGRDAESENIKDIQKVPSPSSEKRPVWFVYSGMGSQWAGMGKDLMRIPRFSESIMSCSEALRPVGVDPYSLIMKGDEEHFKSTLNCMVCITAIQIALTDVLRSVGIEPDGILGHSTGEMACGYADGGTTRQQTMLLSYYRGKTVQNGQLPPGAMAAVGMTWQEAKERCPEGVIAACHNGPDSVTISGDEAKVTALVEQLKEEGYFAKMVNSSGIAFHSPSIQVIKPAMLETFKTVITEAYPRTSRWVSTSVPEAQWDGELARTCSAEYHANNAMSPVLFYEALQKIPDNAVAIEIAPHCLLQSVLRRSLANTTSMTGVMKAKHENNLEFFLSAVGRIYQAGVPVSVKNLYPPVTYPVPNGTPMISPLVKWDHAQDWYHITAADAAATGGGTGSSCSFTFDPFAPDSQDLFLLDHVIDGRILFPFTGHLVMAWKALCKVKGLDYMKTQVIMEDVSVFRPSIVSKAVKFDVIICPGQGTFEIIEDDSLIACGKISIVEDKKPFFYENISDVTDSHCERVELETADVYKEFLLRGYEYGPNFRGIYRSCNSGFTGALYWTGNWVTFLDCLLQTALLAERADSLRLPVRLRYLRIDPEKHLTCIEEIDDVQVIPLRNDAHTHGCIAGGVETCDLVAQTVPRRLHASGKVCLEKVEFIKDFDHESLKDFPNTISRIDQYSQVCRAVLKQGLNKWGESNLLKFPNGQMLVNALKNLGNLKVDSELVEKMEDESDCTLLQMLQRMFDIDVNDVNFVATATNLMHSGLVLLDSDRYWASAYLQRVVKPPLDMALENTAGHKFKFCAVDPIGTETAKTVRAFQMTHPLLEPAWTVVGSKLDHLDQDSVQQLELNVIRCDLDAGEEVPDAAKDQDIIILDRVLSRKPDVLSFLIKVRELMRDDGMAIVCEPTADYEIPLFVESLGLAGQMTPDGDKKRKYGLFYIYDDWMAIFKEAGLHVVASQRDSCLMCTQFMLRNVPAEPRDPTFVNIDDVDEFTWIEPLQKAIDETLTETDHNTIWIESTKIRDNGAIGLALCFREESLKVNRFRCLVDVSLKDETPLLSRDSDEVKRILQQDMHASNYRDGHWGSFRHMVVGEDEMHTRKKTSHAFINTLVRGDLSSLNWVESPNQYFSVNPTRKPSQELCSVYYAAINFRDVMLATGRLPPDSIPGDFQDKECLLGMEYSGKLDSGKRIMGMMPAQALATTVVSDRDFSWDVPDHWTLEQGATVPVVYCTVYYALVVRGRLRKGEKVLIHSGSGGVGQAAIAVALSYGCEVYTTVGTEDKKKYLQNRFPQLLDRHFSNSRTVEFEWHIRQETKGLGVDVILNSLSEEKLQASLRCLAQHGRFLEIGKFDLSNNSQLGMAMFLKNVTFHGILLDALMDPHNRDWIDVGRMMQQGILSGVVQPLPATVFSSDKSEEAFRYMAQGKHIGKVLVNIRQETAGLPVPITVNAVVRGLCHPQHVYLITGGLGGFGLELAQWLISRGAKKLVLTSRSGIKNGYQARCLYFWRRTGISVSVSTLDISKEEEALRLIKLCQEMGQLGGLFHLAMVLRDCHFENQNVTNFKEAAAAKYWGTKNLDKSTRELCGDELKWFVVFSSITAGRGNGGQTNYGWANSTMERVVELRREKGYPGIAIQWGAIGDVGVILENMGDNTTVVGGTLPQRMPSCLMALDLFLSWNHPIVSTFIRAETGEKKLLSGQGDMVQAIAHILGVSDVAQLDPNANLGDLGLDSLMGVEIKQALERDYDIVLSMKDIRNLTLNKLKELAKTGKAAIIESDDMSISRTSLKEEDDELEEKERQAEELERQMLQMFRLRVDVNDLLQTEPVVLMNGVTEGNPIFFVHSIEGISGPLKPLASKLNVPAYCFQSVPSAPQNTIDGLGRYYIEKMKKIQPVGPYRLVGYSYGACVAFEMAVILQKEDKKSLHSLCLLDGSHHYMQTYRKVYRAAYGVSGDSLANDALFESEIMCALTLRFANVDYKAFRFQLLSQTNWKGRMTLVVDKVMQTGLFKTQEAIVAACEGVRKKFLMADQYVPNTKLEGDVTLVRAEQGAAREEDVGRDYGVGEVVQGEVHVFVVEGDHDTFVQGSSSDKTAAIIAQVCST